MSGLGEQRGTAVAVQRGDARQRRLVCRDAGCVAARAAAASAGNSRGRMAGVVLVSRELRGRAFCQDCGWPVPVPSA